MTRYDFAILGAGALGSILGAHLARAGHRVAMLARGARAAHVAQHGLRVRGLAELDVAVPTLTDPGALAGAGTLIVATKTPGTAAALATLRGADFGVTYSIQNGLLKNEQLIAAFGRPRVLGALADTSGELLPGGEVLFTRNVGIHVGELGGGDSPRAREAAHALDASGVRAAASAQIESLEWSKFCAWVGLTAVALATRKPTWQYLSDLDSALLVVRLLRETGRLARAQGIALVDGIVLPTATLCGVGEQEALALVREIGATYRAQAPEHRMSALQDLEAGRPLETDATLGYAAARARQLGLALPLLDAFYRLVAALDRARLPAAAPGTEPA